MFEPTKDRSAWAQRLVCLFRGHHLLSVAPAYAQERPEGHREELHYCARCGLAVWTSPAGAAGPSKWSDTGQA